MFAVFGISRKYRTPPQVVHSERFSASNPPLHFWVGAVSEICAVVAHRRSITSPGCSRCSDFPERRTPVNCPIICAFGPTDPPGCSRCSEFRGNTEHPPQVVHSERFSASNAPLHFWVGAVSEICAVVAHRRSITSPGCSRCSDFPERRTPVNCPIICAFGPTFPSAV